MKLVAFHLFNDYSGSPKVLKMMLDGLLKKGYQVDVVTSHGGVLDELKEENVQYHYYRYKFSVNPVVTMLRYSWAQFFTFLISFRYLFQKDITFFINTILPLGPALAGRMMGKRVVYYYHEDAQTKGGFYKALAWFMCRVADEIICVSDYQRSLLERTDHVTVVPNALPERFVQSFCTDSERSFQNQKVLLIASLKKYKGILQFIELANQMPMYHFEAVVNDDQHAIDSFLKEEHLDVPANLQIYPRQEDVKPFYEKASLLLNLSDPQLFVETFGLTVLEAMAAALPVIVPTKGGVAELVEEGVTGYHIGVDQLDRVGEQIKILLSDQKLYESMSQAAWERSKVYSETKYIERIKNVLLSREN